MLNTRIQGLLTAIMLSVVMALAGCGSGGGGGTSGGTTAGGSSFGGGAASGGTTTGGTGAGTGTTGTPTITLAMTSLAGVPTNTLTSGAAANVTATVTDASGLPVPNAVVTFTTNNTLAIFTPATGTALTNSSGVATTLLNAATLTAAGAATVTAAATFAASGGTTASATSAPLGYSVGSASVTLGAMTIGSPTISAFGSTSVTVPVLVNGLPSTVPISVTFTSGCVASGRATITSPVTSVNGVVTTTYKDSTCSSAPTGEVITASVSGSTATATGTVIASAPVANNIQFVSVSKPVLLVSGTGSTTLPQSSVVTFRVVDATNRGVAGIVVNYSLVPVSTTTGVSLSSSNATSDGNGEVTVSVTSGTVPTPVWVVASLASNPAVTSQSNALTITTGVPTQNFFSLSVQTHNIDGWSFDGTTTTLTVIASDRLGNPVPDGTVINFVSEGGQITLGTSGTATCTTVAGTCFVTLRSAESRPRGETTTATTGTSAGAVDSLVSVISATPPNQELYVQNGRVTILAYALGEKSFVDSNGNNIWDVGETFYDLGDPFLDSNENGRWDSGTAQPDLAEQFFTLGAVANAVPCTAQITNTTPFTPAALPSIYSTAPSKQNTCSGTISGSNIRAYVRRSDVIVFSGTGAQITADPTSSLSVSPRTFKMNTACRQTIRFFLYDENNNPMPKGTTLGLQGNSNTVTYVPAGGTTPSLATITVNESIVQDATLPTLHSVTVDGGVTCVGGGAAGTGYPGGTFNLLISSFPRNVTRAITITIQ